MGLTRKASPAAALNPATYELDIPKLPDEVRERFPPMAQWQEQWERWWFQLRDQLRQEHEAMEAEIRILNDRLSAVENNPE